MDPLKNKETNKQKNRVSHVGGIKGGKGLKNSITVRKELSFLAFTHLATAKAFQINTHLGKRNRSPIGSNT